MRENLLKAGKKGEHVFGIAKTESQKILIDHKMMKNREEALKDEGRETGRVLDDGDSTRMEEDKREHVKTMEMRQELSSQED